MDDAADRSSTVAVLMDVGAARREVDEKLSFLGPELARSILAVEDGLQPQLRRAATLALVNIVKEPTWANALHSAVLNTISLNETDNPAVLRRHLVQVASIAVQWIEALDERNKA
jgi:hypothetical protein